MIEVPQGELQNIRPPAGPNKGASFQVWLNAARNRGVQCKVIKVKLIDADGWCPVGAVLCNGKRYGITEAIDNNSRKVCFARELTGSNKGKLWRD